VRTSVREPCSRADLAAFPKWVRLKNQMLLRIREQASVCKGSKISRKLVARNYQ
jgi:hypothetical protein